MNYKLRPEAAASGISKIFLAMKLLIVLTFIVLTQAHASTYGQTVTIREKNVPVEEILLKIEKQTSYHFIYDSKLQFLKTKLITINEKNSSISDILDKCLAGLPVSYKIVQQTIALKSQNIEPAVNIARDQVISGQVTDELGLALPGVSVLVKGTTIGVATDKNGKYSLNIPNEQGTLVFSMLNYETQEIKLSGENVINVSLKPAENKLNEVVVVGYGTQAKSNVSGAITTVSQRDVALSPSPNLATGLAGRISGVTINNRGGEPGNEGVEIFIRGKSTNGDASPLYIIDGIVRDFGQLNFIPPNDVESITVLKDASAAIYGSRAANGVILVTTKRGKTGKASVTATWNSALIQQERIPEYADAFTYATMANLQQKLAGQTETYSANDLELFKNGSDPLNHPNTDWADLVFKNWSLQNRADLSVSGGSENVKYFVAAGYLTQNSPFKDSFTYDKQYHFRSNIDAQVTRDLKLSLDVAGRKRDNVSSKMDWAHVYLTLPTLNGIYPNGLYGPGRTGNNAAIMAREKDYGYVKQDAGNLLTTFSADYKIPGVEGLSLQGNFAYDYDNNYLKTYQGVTYYYLYDAATDKYNRLQNSNAAAPSLNIDYPNGNSVTSNLKLNFKRTFAQQHTIDAFIGFEQNNTQSYSISAGRTNFASGSLQELFAGDSNKDNQSNDGSSARTGRQNLFGRALYSYNDKYTLQFQFRYDGSQNFPVGKRYGFFPGISGAWNLSKENFLKDSKVVSNLKLRASYGELGNDKVGPYQYLTSYSYGRNYAFNGTTNQGIYQTNAPNPNITWEVAKTVDVGLEASLFNGAISGEIDYFKTNRSNILAPRNASVPTYTGLSLPAENIGKTKNEGIELSLSHSKRLNNDFNYAVQGNFTYAKNTVVFVDETPGIPSYQKQEGKPIGAPALYEILGVYRDQAQVDATTHLAGVGPGDLIRRDVNGDGIINNLDMVRQDYGISPQIVYGLNFRFDYKQFQLSLGFQGQAKVIGERYSILPFDPLGWGNFSAAYAKDVWTPDNINARNPKPGQNFDKGGNGTTFNYESAAFLKLKTAELGYNFSNKLLTRAGMQNARVFVSGSNLFFIHDNFKDQNMSPEQTNWGWGLAQQRVLNLGLSVTF
nr:TonB-dependent receptor [Pedobacter panaciterrae]